MVVGERGCPTPTWPNSPASGGWAAGPAPLPAAEPGTTVEVDRTVSRAVTVSLAGPIVLAAEILAAGASPSGSKSTRSYSSTPTPANCCAYQHRTAEADKGIADAMNRKIKGSKIHDIDTSMARSPVSKIGTGLFSQVGGTGFEPMPPRL